MAYRLKKGESIPENVKRIVHEEIDSALKQLRNGSGQKRDEAVHEARKSIKKVRGLIRLAEPELGRVYRSTNTRLGDIGRKLSEIRDATAIIEVFDGLVEKHKDALQKAAAAGIRRGLETSKKETEQTAGIAGAVKGATAALRAIDKQAAKWPLKNDGFSAIAQGFKDRYRRGRQAMSVARKNGTPENFHEWRKRVKDHWYHVRLIESLWTDIMQSREASLHDLETWLGDDHNLVVLSEKLDREPEKYGDEETIQVFRALIEQEQKDLREKSLSLGERLYEGKPRRFVGDLEKLWNAWQKEPESMKEEEKQHREAAKKAPAQAASAKPKKKAAA